MLLATASAPTPMWYATRGSGYTALVLLSASVVLGLMTSVRWSSARWPRFLSQALHRNISLLAVVFLVIHVVTSVVDPFAGLGWRDAVVPFLSTYRPLWLGLGVVGLELFLAVLITSLFRHRLGFGLWRAIHLLAYASWPVAVLHSLGTGTDTKSAWALLLAIACAGSVSGAVIWRLADGWPRLAPLRTAGIATSIAALFALAAWTASGPLQEGWARASGTPADLLAGAPASSRHGAPASPTPAPLAANLDDQVTGSVQQSGGSTTATINDVRDPSLQLTITANADGSATLRVTRNGSTLCSAPATVGDTISATCGRVIVDLQLFSRGFGAVAGTLTTQAGS